MIHCFIILLFSTDDTSFRFIQDAGSEYKTVFSRVLWCKQADLGYGIGYNRLYLNKYNAYYKDQEGIEFEVDARIARSHAEQYAEILGRIPSILRKCLKTFLIIKGLVAYFYLNHELTLTVNTLCFSFQKVKIFSLLETNISC